MNDLGFGGEERGIMVRRAAQVLTPLVTVLVPAYNAAGFIRETIESALRQTYDRFEVVVVDDGSTDETLAVLRGFEDKRLRLIGQANQGAPGALNTGLRAARGEYIGLLDHDDLWRETKLSRHVDFFGRHPEIDVTFSWSTIIDRSGQDLGPHPARWRGPIAFRQLLKANPMGNTSSLVLRRAAMEAAGGFDPAFPCFYDADLVLRMALLRPENVCAVPEDLTLYRRHGGQMSENWRQMQRDWRLMLEKFRRLAPEDTAVVARQADSNRNWYFARLAYRGGEFGPACSLMGRAVGSDPVEFFTCPWKWKTAAGCVSGRLLPAPAHRTLERLAGFRRG